MAAGILQAGLVHHDEARPSTGQICVCWTFPWEALDPVRVTAAHTILAVILEFLIKLTRHTMRVQTPTFLHTNVRVRAEEHGAFRAEAALTFHWSALLFN